MNLKKWFFIFITTLMLGGITTVIVIPLIGEQPLFGEGWGNFFWGLLMNFGLGLLFSILSQVGFFAYLMLHRFGLGFFRGKGLWNGVQIILILLVFFDAGDMRYQKFAGPDETYLSYFIVPAIFLLLAVVVAVWKAIETRRSAFIPAVFFMFVMTVVELVYALGAGSDKWLWYMYVPVFLCNAWQLLILHRLTGEEANSGSAKSS